MMFLLPLCDLVTLFMLQISTNLEFIVIFFIDPFSCSIFWMIIRFQALYSLHHTHILIPLSCFFTSFWLKQVYVSPYSYNRFTIITTQSIHSLSWSFDKECKNNVRQLLIVSLLDKSISLLWSNAVKAILVEIWFSWFSIINLPPGRTDSNWLS